VELRPAQPRDAALLSCIARAAKAALGYQEQLLRAWDAELSIDAAAPVAGDAARVRPQLAKEIPGSR
jgi:hypothetical protein